MNDTINLPLAIGSRAWLVRSPIGATREITLLNVKIVGYHVTTGGLDAVFEWTDEEGDTLEGTVVAERLLADRPDDFGPDRFAVGLNRELRRVVHDMRLLTTADPKRVGAFTSRTPIVFRDDSPDYQEAMAAEWPEFLTYDPDVGLEFTRLGELVREGRA